jgi:hypothetical protein
VILRPCIFTGRRSPGVFIETLSFVIVGAGAQEAVACPGFDGVGMYVEQACHFVEGEQTLCAQAVVA